MSIPFQSPFHLESQATWNMTFKTPRGLACSIKLFCILQQIAETCYQYHPLGTQFYSGGIGATTFTVSTPYPGYTYPVILNPFQTTQITCNLEIVYNADPGDAGFSNGVFNTSLLPTLQTTVLNIINEYFLSKTLLLTLSIPSMSFRRSYKAHSQE